MRRKPCLTLVLILGLAWGVVAAQQPQPAKPATPPPAKPVVAEGISAAEFARLVRELSEAGGYFRSDNFTSNETSYLHVVDKLRELSTPGGAYIGVGPEQNFSYIAKLRPRIAFIIDIRRQAVIQHLMYKAIFQVADTRAQFLAKLLSRPLTGTGAPKADAAIDELLTWFGKTPATEQLYAANLAELKQVIERDVQFALSEQDLFSLDKVYQSFRTEGAEISYNPAGGWNGPYGYFPTLKDLITGTDLKGRRGNFLTNDEDYEFVRGMQRKHLIIPVVGDFAGTKALPAIGDYLQKHGHTVSAYYLSNVEQFLFDGPQFDQFVANVKKLPRNDKSLFIRAVFNMRMSHPARVPGHMSTTLLQRMSVFLQDYEAGAYKSYYDLVVTHYIAAQ